MDYKMDDWEDVLKDKMTVGCEKWGIIVGNKNVRCISQCHFMP